MKTKTLKVLRLPAECNNMYPTICSNCLTNTNLITVIFYKHVHVFRITKISALITQKMWSDLHSSQVKIQFLKFNQYLVYYLSIVRPLEMVSVK